VAHLFVAAWVAVDHRVRELCCGLLLGQESLDATLHHGQSEQFVDGGSFVWVAREAARH